MPNILHRFTIFAILTVLSVPQLPIIEDFRKMRKTVEDMGLFKPSKFFFTFIMLHIFAAEFIGWLILWYFGTGWIPFIIGACFLTIAQVSCYNFFFSIWSFFTNLGQICQHYRCSQPICEIKCVVSRQNQQ